MLKTIDDSLYQLALVTFVTVYKFRDLISEATVGRMLRQLDIENYTEKVGFKGRKLTPIGKKN